MPIRIKAIRDSARGQTCTIEIPGVCNHDPETTVFAHYQAPGHGGMGTKSDDSSGAYACSSCHDVLDGRSPRQNWIKGDAMQWYWFRGMRRTWKRLLEDEVLTTGKTGSYRQGMADRTEQILEMLQPCIVRDPTLKKLARAIRDLDE